MKNVFYFGLTLTVPVCTCVPLPSMYVDEFGLRQMFDSSGEDPAKNLPDSIDPYRFLLFLLFLVGILVACGVVAYLGCELASCCKQQEGEGRLEVKDTPYWTCMSQTVIEDSVIRYIKRYFRCSFWVYRYNNIKFVQKCLIDNPLSYLFFRIHPV